MQSKHRRCCFEMQLQIATSNCFNFVGASPRFILGSQKNLNTYIKHRITYMYTLHIYILHTDFCRHTVKNVNRKLCINNFKFLATKVYGPHPYHLVATNLLINFLVAWLRLSKFIFLFFPRKIASPNCCNRGNRWLPPLYAVCKLFQLHCEGEFVFSYRKIMTINVQFVLDSDATHTHTHTPRVLDKHMVD